MTTTRREFLVRSAQVAALLGVGVPILDACGSDAKKKPVKQSIAKGLQPEKGPLKILNYEAYVSEDVLAAFKKKYGVEVEVTTFVNDTEAEQKLASGAVKVDVFHSINTSSLPDLTARGILQPLNRDYLTNFGNILAELQNPDYDADAQYTVPYTIYGTGIGYRTDRVDQAKMEADGWSAFWNSGAHKGKVSILDDQYESLALGMLYKGLNDINTGDKKLLDEAANELKKLSGIANIKINSNGYETIADGTVSMAHTWSGDPIIGVMSYLPEGTEASAVGFWHPKDNYIVGNDAMGIPASAEHPVLAHHYLNFLLDNDIAETNFTVNGYLPALTKLDADYLIGKGYVPDHLRSCVPSADERKNALKFGHLTPEVKTLWEDAWSSVKAGG